MAEAKKTFIDKLTCIQANLKAPKGQYNNFGKYKYRSCEDILEAVKPHLAQHGLALILSDEPVLCGEWHYIKATAMITDGTSDCTATAYARESVTKKGMDDSQITGTASSYARKYALNGLFLIDDTKDADTNEQHKATRQASKPKAEPEPKSVVDLSPVRNIFKQYSAAAGLTPQEAVDSVCAAVGTESMEAMTAEQVQKAVNAMQVVIEAGE